MPLQILGKNFQGLIIEIKSKHGCHGLALSAFGFTPDADDADRFELKLGFVLFLFVDIVGNRLLALGADAACFPFSTQFIPPSEYAACLPSGSATAQRPCRGCASQV
jgi:hypothetical protein